MARPQVSTKRAVIRLFDANASWGKYAAILLLLLVNLRLLQVRAVRLLEQLPKKVGRYWKVNTTTQPKEVKVEVKLEIPDTRTKDAEDTAMDEVTHIREEQDEIGEITSVSDDSEDEDYTSESSSDDGHGDESGSVSESASAIEEDESSDDSEDGIKLNFQSSEDEEIGEEVREQEIEAIEEGEDGNIDSVWNSWFIASEQYEKEEAGATEIKSTVNASEFRYFSFPSSSLFPPLPPSLPLSLY